LQAVARAPYPFRVIYVNQPVVNAFAAPGGYVVVFRGLLEQADTAEEFAGVLAHEMEHVVLKHSMRALAREFSGRALLSLMAIDSSGTPGALQAGAQLASLSYARDDEQSADLQGAALLERAHVSTSGLAAFLKKVQQLSPDSGPNYLATHPATGDRIEKLNEATRQAPYAAPLMTSAEWQQARRVCTDH
jgi:predicted Zn-dependent protease